MALSKYGLKALGMCALVLGLMAFGTGSAQAETGAHWNVNGSSISSTLLPFLKIKEIEKLESPEAGKHLVLLTKILGNTVHILCSEAHLINFHFLLNGGSLGLIRFLHCIILVAGKVQAACEPKSGGVAGNIDTVHLKDLIVLHKFKEIVGEKEIELTETLDRLEPEVGESFTVIETSSKCSVGEKIPVKGKFFIKDCQNEFGVEKVDHLIEEGLLTHLYVISDTAEHASKIDGSAILALEGTGHEGLKWSGTPA